MAITIYGIKNCDTMKKARAWLDTHGVAYEFHDYKAAGVEKGSQTPSRGTVGTVTMAQVREIAEKKMPDLNANDIEAAAKMVAGTARSMGLEVAE